MYMLRIAKSAKKQIDIISKNHRNAIISALKDIKEDPFIGKPLKRELSGLYSFRVSVYRIIYKINLKDKIIIILTAGHRAVVYQ